MVWMEGNDKIEEIKTKGFKIVSKQFYILNDQNFLFCEQSQDNESEESQINQVIVKFNDYQTQVIVTENSPKYDF